MLILLTCSIGLLTEIVMAVAALASCFIALSAYRKTIKEELVKRSELITYEKSTDTKIDNHDKRILKIEGEKASSAYVDKQDRSIQHRIDGIEKRTGEDIHEIRTMLTAVHEFLIKNK